MFKVIKAMGSILKRKSPNQPNEEEGIDLTTLKRKNVESNKEVCKVQIEKPKVKVIFPDYKHGPVDIYHDCLYCNKKKSKRQEDIVLQQMDKHKHGYPYCLLQNVNIEMEPIPQMGDDKLFFFDEETGEQYHDCIFCKEEEREKMYETQFNEQNNKGTTHYLTCKEETSENSTDTCYTSASRLAHHQNVLANNYNIKPKAYKAKLKKNGIDLKKEDNSRAHNSKFRTNVTAFAKERNVDKLKPEKGNLRYQTNDASFAERDRKESKAYKTKLRKSYISVTEEDYLDDWKTYNSKFRTNYTVYNLDESSAYEPKMGPINKYLKEVESSEESEDCKSNFRPNSINLEEVESLMESYNSKSTCFNESKAYKHKIRTKNVDLEEVESSEKLSAYNSQGATFAEIHNAKKSRTYKPTLTPNTMDSKEAENLDEFRSHNSRLATYDTGFVEIKQPRVYKHKLTKYNIDLNERRAHNLRCKTDFVEAQNLYESSVYKAKMKNNYLDLAKVKSIEEWRAHNARFTTELVEANDLPVPKAHKPNLRLNCVDSKEAENIKESNTHNLSTDFVETNSDESKPLSSNNINKDECGAYNTRSKSNGTNLVTMANLGKSDKPNLRLNSKYLEQEDSLDNWKAHNPRFRTTGTDFAQVDHLNESRAYRQKLGSNSTDLEEIENVQEWETHNSRFQTNGTDFVEIDWTESKAYKPKLRQNNTDSDELENLIEYGAQSIYRTNGTSFVEINNLKESYKAKFAPNYIKLNEVVARNSKFRANSIGFEEINKSKESIKPKFKTIIKDLEDVENLNEWGAYNSRLRTNGTDFAEINSKESRAYVLKFKQIDIDLKMKNLEKTPNNKDIGVENLEEWGSDISRFETSIVETDWKEPIVYTPKFTANNKDLKEMENFEESHISRFETHFVETDWKEPRAYIQKFSSNNMNSEEMYNLEKSHISRYETSFVESDWKEPRLYMSKFTPNNKDLEEVENLKESHISRFNRSFVESDWKEPRAYIPKFSSNNMNLEEMDHLEKSHISRYETSFVESDWKEPRLYMSKFTPNNKDLEEVENLKESHISIFNRSFVESDWKEPSAYIPKFSSNNMNLEEMENLEKSHISRYETSFVESDWKEPKLYIPKFTPNNKDLEEVENLKESHISRFNRSFVESDWKEPRAYIPKFTPNNKDLKEVENLEESHISRFETSFVETDWMGPRAYIPKFKPNKINLEEEENLEKCGAHNSRLVVKQNSQESKTYESKFGGNSKPNRMNLDKAESSVKWKAHDSRFNTKGTTFAEVHNIGKSHKPTLKTDCIDLEKNESFEKSRLYKPRSILENNEEKKLQPNDIDLEADNLDKLKVCKSGTGAKNTSLLKLDYLEQSEIIIKREIDYLEKLKAHKLKLIQKDMDLDEVNNLKELRTYNPRLRPECIGMEKNDDLVKENLKADIKEIDDLEAEELKDAPLDKICLKKNWIVIGSVIVLILLIMLLVVN